jgi:uncharacterized protein (TIRG00374 family)
MKSKILKLFIGILIGVILFLIWLHFVDISVISLYIRNIRIPFAIVALIFYLLAYFIRSLRWRLLLHRVQPLSPAKTFLIMMAGNFTNYLIPFKAGEFMKCFFIKKMYGARVSSTLPSVFIDKLFDTMGIIFVFLLVPLLAVTLPSILNYLILTIVIILLAGWSILFLAIHAGDKVVKMLKKIFFFIPAKFEARIEERIFIFVEGLAIFREEKKLFFPVFSLSILAIIMDSLFFYSLFFAFGATINYFYVLLGYSLIYLSYIIPHPPAQLGSNELIMILIFVAGLGVQTDIASAIMLFSHFLTGLVIVIIGMIAYGYAGVKFMTLINKGDNIYD